MASPILLILGAGANIGAHVAKAFAAKGYKVALASRSAPTVDDGSLHVTVDLSKPETVPGVFETVKQKLGAAPSVVVYNAALFSPDLATDQLSQFSLEKYTASLTVNNISVVAALHHAVLGFRTLPSGSKTFIYTGNALNVRTTPALFTFGIGKNASAYAIRNLVESGAYKKEGISFYYADERTSTGQPAGEAVDGPAAAEEYLRLAERADQGPWLDTFVKGTGYKDFESGAGQ